ncbi:MAG: hypothetical protein ACI8RZ_007170 [Myxococcota bacterium]|jgi:hypothetical protein
MGHRIRFTDAGLPWLDAAVLDTIFDCVYGVTDAVRASRPLLKDPAVGDLVAVLLTMQAYNAKWRPRALGRWLPVLEGALGELEHNSEGTTQWLALAVALRDLYDLRSTTLGELLTSTTVRK